MISISSFNKFYSFIINYSINGRIGKKTKIVLKLDTLGGDIN